VTLLLSFSVRARTALLSRIPFLPVAASYRKAYQVGCPKHLVNSIGRRHQASHFDFQDPRHRYPLRRLGGLLLSLVPGRDLKRTLKFTKLYSIKSTPLPLPLPPFFPSWPSQSSVALHKKASYPQRHCAQAAALTAPHLITRPSGSTAVLSESS
jgi:hypothetical protein